MKIHELTSITTRPSKRLGRGHGSGKGKTSARGMKGQKARGSIRLGFEGGQLRLIKRLPFKRGVGNKPVKDTIGVNLDRLEVFKKGETVNVATLLEKGLVSPREVKKRTIKILGRGDLAVALKVEVPTSSSAATKITAAGGSVLENSNPSK